ncbi:hypothetical protein [Kyrpidia spormannii]|uniref:Uncharacterized protein n=2 Tax=Kyrpidia spormannii TaxID=2055160 RepID=A0A6F9EGY1_9BACL|nr:hypothetical protein [Kyrpidia spormannii]CAB3394862.1 protein of unknown function [Kyrpidia spormannii]CAB3395830.1 protein of unknown function [Kyrpidia spormannii]
MYAIQPSQVPVPLWRPTIALRSLSPHLGPSINNRKGAIWFALIISLVGIVYLIIGLLLAFALNLMTLGFVRLNGHNILILPARLIPFLGNAYSRACEFTCDRIATYVTASPAAAERGLTMLAVGRDLYADIDVDEYLHDSEQNRGGHEPSPLSSNRTGLQDCSSWEKDFVTPERF